MRTIAAAMLTMLSPTILGIAACTGAPRVQSPTTAASPASFPRDWLGSWSGSMFSFAPGKAGEAFFMRLDIAETADPARFAWTITYDGSAGRQVRSYELVVRDGPAGSYAIDERNGIVLETRWIAGAIYSVFDVAGSRLTVREELASDANGPRIDVEMITARESDIQTTGPADDVRTLAPISVQRGSLRKVASEG